jgi:hypothetical protein
MEGVRYDPPGLNDALATVGEVDLLVPFDKRP